MRLLVDKLASRGHEDDPAEHLPGIHLAHKLRSDALDNRERILDAARAAFAAGRSCKR